ncbi:lysophospholipid acyltransferase family protein [Legionella jordanis]|uniref:1-acyl-sn-glycerol-3-phosphate acyltransferase n=1 Tax=Legionella jordanis TaxID=456 RepID=A0A0W0VDN6_9GAMM|nr:lysophospholipid acyltransferase family protein [Legionella jordanis]KTD18191.1 1-acyl-sn-glycerol-3-phosphate acyltransferase [Legionella jordanis]RMX01151.1 1-acyl-sn-glycerol-3-phosphate acyltransferase [Legionella jordanis]RMX21381.1 1-acyl-sn-glycerol-3-phosphate acyltransferase [Legionella jordanis]VEH13716.1 1-acyl-sn-glycerol-3-phosphate acyltransferase [Legionella jordanis]HAT8714573.1 1-acyl-sn-glycerol-3-phosphate acyltransferase [Legionella jordanis]
MKISKIRTQWIIFLSVSYTAYISIRSILKSMTGKTNRTWVNMMIHRWTDKLLNLVGVKCKIVNPYGVEPQPGQATLIMCNHSSLYDIPISFKAFPHHSIRMLAKVELSRIPLLGKGMEAAEFPFIDRKNRHQAIRDLESARKLMESGIVIWIAPEGTRSKDGKLAPFKKGAFITAISSKATIIPIGIRGAYNILPARTTRLNLNQTAEIHIGEPIDASKYSMENREELVQRVHDAIQILIGEGQ